MKIDVRLVPPPLSPAYIFPLFSIRSIILLQNSKSRTRTRTQILKIHIDEVRFAGRLEYNRGRLLQGDAPATDEDGDDDDVHKMQNHAWHESRWAMRLWYPPEHRFPLLFG